MSDQPFASATTAPPPANRLSIAHLMLWTATTAICLAVDSRLVPPVAAFLLGPVCGLGLLGCGLAIARLRGMRISFPTLPGHFLLVLVGIGWLAVHLAVLVETYRSVPRGEGFVIGIVFAIVFGTSICVAAHVASGDFRLWQIMFLCLIGVHASVVFSFCIPLVFVVGTLLLSFAALVLGLIATLDDFVRQPPRDWLHWAGIASVAILGLIGVAVMLLDGPVVLY